MTGEAEGAILSCDFLHFRTVVYNNLTAYRQNDYFFGLSGMRTDFSDKGETSISRETDLKASRSFAVMGCKLNYQDGVTKRRQQYVGIEK